jgi:hypothetical protein
VKGKWNNLSVLSVPILILVITVGIFLRISFSGQPVSQERQGTPSPPEEWKPETEEAESPATRLELFEGLPAVRLSDEWIARSGIEIGKLQVVSSLAEARAYGEVLDVQPLLNLRADYLAAQSEEALAQAALTASERGFERIRLLHNDTGTVSTKQLQEAESRLAADRARLTAARRHQQTVREGIMQSWGSTLADWVTVGGSDHLERLLRREDVLLLITLDAQTILPDGTTFVHAGRSPDRTQARKAYLISPAPRTSSVSQGETYIFRTPGDKLRTGMRVNAWITLGKDLEQGVDVPQGAIVWYAGQPWVYVEVDKGLFTRRSVATYRQTDFGWFVGGVLKPDDRVVIRGGQMLLSEEFRGQIPEEDPD